MNPARNDCGGGQGTLEWALQKCSETTNCHWIHDYNCDGVNWRFCAGINIKDYMKPNEKACAKVKQGNFYFRYSNKMDEDNDNFMNSNI